MTVGVAICTFNRADRLERVLASLESVADPSVPILVVDNGSTDHTAEVIEAFAARLTCLQVVVEDHVGLSNARNRALWTLDTDYVAFLDDDVTIDPGWLQAIQMCAQDRRRPAGMAGRIDLAWESPRPLWSIQVPLVDSLLAGMDLGSEPRILDSNETPYGANMVLDRVLCQRVGGFRTHLGRRGRSLMSMEEVELVTRVREITSRPFLWCPHATVTHAVPAERQSFRYQARRSFAQGRSETIVAAVCDAYRPSTDRPWRSLLHSTIDGLKSRRRAELTHLALIGAYVTGRQIASIELRSGRYRHREAV